MIRKLGWGALLASVTWLAGCAGTPQAHVPLDAQKVASKTERIGVAMTVVPKADTYFPGAGCLLCMAAASVANSSLTSFTQTLPPEDLPALKATIAQALVKKMGRTPSSSTNR